MPSPKFTALADDGTPCASCKLYAYVAGTTTPQDTFNNVDLAPAHANPNPIILDAAGRATVFLSAASYKFVLTDSTGGTTYWTQDNISANASFTVATDIAGLAGEAISAGQVVYLSDGSGSKTAGSWYLARADLTYASSSALAVGIAPSAIASGASGAIRLAGRVSGLTGLVAGTTYYVSSTPGALTSTAPANTRQIGAADSTTSIVQSTLISGFALLGGANIFTNTAGQTMQKLILAGSTSGTVTLKVPAVAGTNTITFPAGTTDFSATGGSGYVLKQDSVGAAITVGTIPPITFVPTYTTKSADYTAVANDFIVLAGTAAHTITIPLSASNANKPIWIVNNSTAAWPIARTSSDTLALTTGFSLQPGAAAQQGDAVQLIADGVTNWAVSGTALIRPPRTPMVTNFEAIGNRFTSTVSGGSNVVSTSGVVQDTTSTISRYASLKWDVDYSLGNIYANNPTFTMVVAVDTIGTDLQAYWGLGHPTFATSGITFTPRHIGFKLIRASSGTTSLFATQGDGTTENASSALTTVVATDNLNLVAIVNGSTSVAYYWSKNGSAWSAPTVLTSNMPTTVPGTGGLDGIWFGVTNAGVATQTTMELQGASYVR